MNDLSVKNPVRRVANAFGHLIGRSSLSVTGEFAAVGRYAPRSKGYTQIPEPTYTAGPTDGPIAFNANPAGPSRTEIRNQSLVDEAMRMPEPAPEDLLPPLYSSHR